MVSGIVVVVAVAVNKACGSLIAFDMVYGNPFSPV